MFFTAFAGLTPAVTRPGANGDTGQGRLGYHKGFIASHVTVNSESATKGWQVFHVLHLLCFPFLFM
jgi:hypothetical protein